ncbi:MAG: response regulator [bacterium]
MDSKNGWTVLVATKDKSIRKVVKETLSNSQSKVILVSGVKQFFEKLLGEDIDLIIYDPKITSLKGLDAFALAKSYHPNIPSILVYDYEKYEVIRSVLDKGVIYRMLKPINEQDLAQIYDRVRMRRTNGIEG